MNFLKIFNRIKVLRKDKDVNSVWAYSAPQPGQPGSTARRERAGTVTACGAPPLARSPTTARPAIGGGVGEVSTRGLQEGHRTRLKGAGLTDVVVEWLCATVVHGGNGSAATDGGRRRLLQH
jgi:hypothetical protein